MGMLVGGGVAPVRFQRSMVFIDGTNLFKRLDSANLNLARPFVSTLHESLIGSRQLVRAYLYTVEQELSKALVHHGKFLEGLRIVKGEGILKADGNVKEKGVDALLVADLVYHAAVRNYDYALIITTDTDFVYAIKRVEDFGCKTGVLGICTDLPRRLEEACDEPRVLRAENMLQSGWAVHRTTNA